MKHAIRHLHFVGIGGAGMSAIAEVLRAQGYTVSGSDLSASAATARLQALGARVFIGHAAQHMAGAQVVVTSSAVPADNPEVQAAREAGVPVVPRALLLAELLRTRTGVAIAGTHGKTTTTSLAATVLMEAGVDPSFVIGGTLHSAGANARCGGGEHIVVEADESDASFLLLSPLVAVVTNIDADHMDTYGHDLGRLQQAFVDFLHRLPFYGRAIVCGDDPGVRAVLGRVQRPLTRYGLADGNDLQALQVRALPGGQMAFTARQAGHADLPLTLQLAGTHNVANALAVLAVARELGLPDSAAVRAFAGFAGVGRRFDRHGDIPTADGGQATLIDDYGHHPAELAAVLAAARGAYPGRRLVVAFQPHRYTRTRDCLGDFARVLAAADVVCLTEVYAAGEPPLPGADGAALAAALRAGAGPAVHFDATLPALADRLRTVLRGGDLCLSMGAGSIAGLPALLKPATATPATGGLAR